MIITDDLALRDKTIEHVQNKMVNTYSIKCCFFNRSFAFAHSLTFSFIHSSINSLTHSLTLLLLVGLYPGRVGRRGRWETPYAPPVS